MKSGKMTVTPLNWLADGRRGVALAGLLLLAYLVILFCWLTRVKLPNVPAKRLPQTLLAILWTWLTGIKWRIIPAGALLVAIMAASAGSTLGSGNFTLTVTSSDFEYNTIDQAYLSVSPGVSQSFTLGFTGDPTSLSGVECGDSLLVHSSGTYLGHVLLSETNHHIVTGDKNNDNDCEDEGEVWWDEYHGNSVTVTLDPRRCRQREHRFFLRSEEETKKGDEARLFVLHQSQRW